MNNYKTTNAPSIIFRLEELTDNEQKVLFNIADLQNKDIEINQGLLSYVCKRSITTIKKRLDSLEEKGYITRETKFIDKKKQTKYIIQWNKINEYSTDSDFINNEELEEVEITPNEEPTENNLTKPKQYTDMGNYIGTIKEKEINYSMESIISWEQYKADYGYVIKKIIEGYNSTLKINHKQAEEDLKSLLKKSVSKPYKNRIISIINNNVYNKAN